MSLLIAIMLAQAGAAQVEAECIDPVTQQDMNYCAAQSFHVADAALNAQWRVTVAEMRMLDARLAADGLAESRPGFYDSLLAAQRAWLTFRDAHCQSEGMSVWGGSLMPLIVAGCRTEMTLERTEQLRHMAEDWEGW